MDMEDELSKVYKESVKYLESMSALELMKKAALFTDDLEKLMARYPLPVPVLVGCLITEAHRLSAEPDNMILDTRLMKSFKLFQRYIDEKFMKKEQP